MWNYRVCKVKNNAYPKLPFEAEFLYSIKEVYYNSDGTIKGYAPADVENWSSPEELKGTLELMLTAFDRPILGPE